MKQTVDRDTAQADRRAGGPSGRDRPLPYNTAGRFLRERFGGPVFRPPTSRPELAQAEQVERALREMDRRHTWEDSRRAIAALRGRGIRACAHMILGTPWEPVESQLRGARRLSDAGADAVKIHHLQILKGSRMARLRPVEHWPLPSWREYALLAADFLERRTNGSL